MTDLTLGILAHADAGKTTLSEALLYSSGAIRELGRVDHRDTFLDTDEMERDRGITIYFKQAVFELGNLRVTLLDTPGHSDLSAEAERVLSVLDCAVLVISAADGVQSHTRTLWKLLEEYNIPVFMFVNKMDQPGAGKDALMKNITAELSQYAVDFSDTYSGDFYENIALCDERLMDIYIEKNAISISDIALSIRGRRIFPVCFGSALKLTGMDEFEDVLSGFALPAERGREFGAKVFKISRDSQGNRLTHIKITGGSLKVRDTVTVNSGGNISDSDRYTGQNSREEVTPAEKISRIRIYNGENYKEVREAAAGTVCAVLGLTSSRQGDGLGSERAVAAPVLKPVLSYRIDFSSDINPHILYGQLKELEDEEPELHITWNENTGGAGKPSNEIMAEVMGDVQTEVLIKEIKDRYGADIEFSEGSVMYRETIAFPVEGVGHFEPLKHYAEVHLIITPTERGSGITASSECPEDALAKNWQRLILTHIMEKEHRGVLTGSPLTDVHISVVSGKAHLKHTEGGDFRQAVYRAVRQGLMEAESILLEPYCEYTITLPSEFTGRIMTDLDRAGARQDEIYHHETKTVLTGRAPYSTIRNYQRELSSYTRGLGRITLTMSGYDLCHNTDEAVSAIGYEPEFDIRNPSHSVFCIHGSGCAVPWYEVKSMMHLPPVLNARENAYSDTNINPAENIGGKNSDTLWISPDEVEAILKRTYYSNSGENKANNKYGRRNWKKKTARDDMPAVTMSDKAPKHTDKSNLDKYLLIDGYNVIFAWQELSELAEVNIDSAREKLLDILDNYSGMNDIEIIAVFDAYRLENHPEELAVHGNINVVFTKTAQTADTYIEKFVHDNRGKYDISVVTSDRLEQIIILGNNAALISSHEFEERVRISNERIRGMLDASRPLRLRDMVDAEALELLEIPEDS